jgi:hypothetical protein
MTLFSGHLPKYLFSHILGQINAIQVFVIGTECVAPFQTSGQIINLANHCNILFSVSSPGKD